MKSLFSLAYSCAAAATLSLGTSACRAPAPPPPEDLDNGARVIREMMSPRKLEAAGFYGAHHEAKPSDFVGFISSDIGAVLWPSREGALFADELDPEQSRAIGETVIPKGVAFKRNRPDPNGGRQIVYRADDEAGEVVVEGYVDPSSDPVFVRRWEFPL